MRDVGPWIDLARRAIRRDRYAEAELAVVQVWQEDPDTGIQLLREQLDAILAEHGAELPYHVVTAIARRCSLLFFWANRVEGGPGGPRGGPSWSTTRRGT